MVSEKLCCCPLKAYLLAAKRITFPTPKHIRFQNHEKTALFSCEREKKLVLLQRIAHYVNNVTATP